jgi:NADH-quinone oxidoreductase subunit C
VPDEPVPEDSGSTKTPSGDDARAEDAPAEDTGAEDTGAEDTGAAEPEPEPAPAPPAYAELAIRLEGALGDAIVEQGDAFGTLTVRLRPDAWRRAAEVARTELECDYLSFVAGLDWQPAPREGAEAGGDTSAPVQPTEMTFGVAGSAGRFQVFAHVQSTRRHWGVTFKTDVDADDPVVDSWVAVYPGADWHERECWEMYGIRFDGHPSLRHLYLPSAFEGHPLRKDFPLLARVVKPWPGLVDVEPMPEEPTPEAPAEVASGDSGVDAESDES